MRNRHGIGHVIKGDSIVIPKPVYDIVAVEGWPADALLTLHTKQGVEILTGYDSVTDLYVVEVVDKNVPSKGVLRRYYSNEDKHALVIFWSAMKWIVDGIERGVAATIPGCAGGYYVRLQ
jgi:hypothetical protein